MSATENPVVLPQSAKVALASLTEEERQTALERFQLLRPHLEDGASLREIARAARIAYRTAARHTGKPGHRPGMSPARENGRSAFNVQGWCHIILKVTRGEVKKAGKLATQ